MKLRECQLTDELFTHNDDDGTQTTWNVTRLVAWCRENNVEVVPVAVDAEHAEFCKTSRGLERDRFEQILAHGAVTKPILFVQMPDESYLLVDGTHRYVMFFEAQQQVIPGWIVSYAQAQAFVVEDLKPMTEAELMAPSMLNESRRILGFKD